jgi:peptidyl-prolyl cis-trans isomerase SurA
MQENFYVKRLLTDTNAVLSGRLQRQVSIPVALLMAAALFPVAGCKTEHKADVVATVNGHAIMKSEMDKAYEQQLGQQQQQPPSEDQANSLRLNVLRALIDEEIVQQRAAKMNLTATNEEVDAKLNEMKARYTEDQFNQQLAANHTTLDEVKHDLRRSLTQNKLLNKEINSKITVTDADVASYYNQHKSEYNLIQTQYHLAQIAVTDVPSAQPVNLQNSKATTDAEAKKKIQALKNRLDSGDDFGTLAMNYSEQPETAPNGGDMGFATAEQLKSVDSAFYNAVMKLKPGQVTDILPLPVGQNKKPIGYAIYKLLSIEPAGQRELKDPSVQQQIRQQLHEGRSQLLKNAYFEMLRDQSKVENFFAEQIFKNDAH